MAGSQALGIKGVDNIVFYVNDLERSHAFYVDRIDFRWTGRSSEALERATGERSRVYEAGQARMTVTQPTQPTSPSGRYLKRHPDGISVLAFEVEDVEQTFRVLDERGATLVDAIQHAEDAGGRLSWFDITTPFGEALFRFQQREGHVGAAAGFETFETSRGGDNRFGFTHYDHITSNFLTLGPMSLWCKHVMGLEEYWGIQFHTDDVAPDNDHGSGLKSVVLWDPHSGVKFANNEPMRPYFESSQIYTFVVDNIGPGIQHTALATEDIISCVRGLIERGIVFMHTPGTYYDALPARIGTSGIAAIDEDIEILRELGILIDGKAERQYLLQIFLKEASGLYGDDKAGPFFFEIIQRKGDKGFGGGNFRALFESIEAEQKKLQRG